SCRAGAVIQVSGQGGMCFAWPGQPPMADSPMHRSEVKKPAQGVADERRAGTVSAVVVNYNGARTVLGTIGSLLRQRGAAVSVIVVDDGSTDGSPDAIERQFPEVEIHREPRNTRNVNRLRN